MAIIVTGDTLVGSGFTVLARIVGADGAPATQASFLAISYEVHETATPIETKDKVGLVINEVIFDALQTDSLWTIDAIGYNFRLVIPGDALVNINNHQIDVLFEPVFGENFFASFNSVPIQTYYDG